MCIPCQGNVLPYRIFRNLCCKSLKFSKKENKEKSYSLMNKERKEQIRTFSSFSMLSADFFEFASSRLLLIYICFWCSTHLWPTFQFHIPRKHPRTRGCLCGKWEASFLPLLVFNWRTFSRWITARWWRQWAKNQVLTNRNSRNRWCHIVRRTMWPHAMRHP